MFSTVSETRMHQLRFGITIAWLLLIASLFYDPVSLWLTDPQNGLSPLRIHPEICVLVQGRCLEAHPYALGVMLFWSVIIPAAVLTLLIFGHEAWRRICPLSFLSQIPRALGWQRQFKRVDAKTGKTRFELAKVKKDSWLARNHLYVQMGLLYLGLCGRLLGLNADRLTLALWLIATILAAITVGYLYGGKSWCQYFCPMAPVQSIFSQPIGLFTSKAHTREPKAITQSMCRVVAQSAAAEQSACVACQSHCIDIDAERAYWDTITQPQQRVLYYGYLGLVVGFFLYHYLYAGSWDYYFSGAWARETQVLATLLQPGFYVNGVSVNIPKLIAVPLFLAFASGCGYGFGCAIETFYRWILTQQNAALSPEIIQHRLFTVWTLTAFHVFFVFAGRPLVLRLPIGLQCLYTITLIVLSLLWFQQAGQRSPDRYSREKLAKRFQLQLLKLGYDLQVFMGKRQSAKALTPGEVMVLAQALPGFQPEQGAQAYRAVLQEVLDDVQGEQASLSGQVELFQLQVHSVALSSVLATQLDQADAVNGSDDLSPAWAAPVHKAPIRRRHPLYRRHRGHRRPPAAPFPVSAAEVIRRPSV
jgi:4Fe-4S binding domain